MPYLFISSFVIAFIGTTAWHFLKPGESPGQERLRKVAEVVSMGSGFLVVVGSSIAVGELLSVLISDGESQISEPGWQDAAFVLGAVLLGTLATLPAWIGAEALAGKLRLKYPLNSD